MPRIMGITDVSFSDWRGEVCAVIFLGGCNLRCHYCHNKGFVDGTLATAPGGKDAFIQKLDRLKSNCTNCICVSGGEPLGSIDLIDFLTEVKSAGFNVKLDTNGTYPGELKEVVGKKLVDYVALDIKAPLSDAEYRKVTQRDIMAPNLIASSVRLLEREMPNSYELRTTCFNPYHTKEKIGELYNSLLRTLVGDHRKLNEVWNAVPAKQTDCLSSCLNSYTEIDGEWLKAEVDSLKHYNLMQEAP